MSDTPQPGPGFGFEESGFGESGFDFAEVVKMLRSEGPLNFDVARQVATWVAVQGAALGDSEDAAAAAAAPAAASPPPAAAAASAPAAADADLMTELTRTAQMHVTEASGLGADLEVRPRTIGRGEWSEEVLAGLRPLLTTLAQRLTATTPETPEGVPESEAAGMADLGNLLTAMAPVLLGVQAGFMAGHLASLTLARYEMPLPLASPPDVTYVAPNITDFERDWQLPREELRFYVAIHEVVHAAMLSVPWVQGRLLRLAEEYVGAFEVDSRLVEERFADLDLADTDALEAAMGDPSELLGAMRTPAQHQVLERLTLTTAVFEGFADHVLAEVGEPLIPSFDRIREASHRHRVERGDAARFLEALLGFEVGRADLERGAAFCRGVVERAGTAGLRRLFEDESRLPTPSELEAPGLWLERISLPT